MVTRTANAKINLALHITGQRHDGYHLLDTLVTFSQFGDKLTFSPANDLQLEITGPYAGQLDANADNLVVQAALSLRNTLKRPDLGAAITLQKNIPVSSGVGGGSADAAATLSGLLELWQAHLDDATLSAIALELGADVPMCLKGTTARVQGIGETITLVPMPAFSIVLINPNQKVSTPAVFQKLTDKNNPPLTPLSEQTQWFTYLANQRNDLEKTAQLLEPSITTCLFALNHNPACKLARMSGSGATCFGLFDNQNDAQAVAHQIQTDHPDWWVVATSTLHPHI